MFEKLNAKYDPYRDVLQENKTQLGDNLPPALPKELSSWHDSAPVVSLSEYLKEHKTHGIKLSQTEDGRPSLCFSPGLGSADMKTERWQIAKQSLELFDAALPDLEQLLMDGLLALPRSSAPCSIEGSEMRDTADMMRGIKDDREQTPE